jgi:hypothetical protein
MPPSKRTKRSSLILKLNVPKQKSSPAAWAAINTPLAFTTEDDAKQIEDSSNQGKTYSISAHGRNVLSHKTDFADSKHASQRREEQPYRKPYNTAWEEARNLNYVSLV